MSWAVRLATSAALAAAGDADGARSMAVASAPRRRLDGASGAPLSMFSPVRNSSGDAQRVLDGETRKEIDSIALITYEQSGEPRRCSGVVIDPFTVLSAAHCGAKSGSNFVIYVNGDAWMSAPLGPNTAIWGGEKQDLKPNTVAMYQTYDVGRVQDDMVVFVLKERVSSAYVPQIPLVATQSYIDSLTEDDTVSLCGFGRQADGTPADLLQCVHLPFKSINHRRCRDNGKDVICVAAQDGRTTCFGDSGGPLYHKPKGTDQFVVLGVLGDGVYPPGTEVFDCAIKLASRYCSVGPKLDWIRSYSKSLITIDSPDTSSVIKKKKEKEQAQLDDGAVGRSVSAFAVLVAVVSSFFP